MNQTEKSKRKKLEKNTKQISKGLRQIGYEINSNTQIIPIIVGNEKLAMDFGKFLFEKWNICTANQISNSAKESGKTKNFSHGMAVIQGY